MPIYVRSARRSIVSLLFTVVIVVSASLLGAATALGHVEYETSEPVADSVLSVAPTEVVVVFDGEIGEAGSVLEVYGPDGGRVDNGDLRLDLDDLDRRRLIVTLPSTLVDGTYRVRVGGASIDGHAPEVQEFGFTLATGTTAPPVSSTPIAGTPVAGTPAATPVATPIALTVGVDATSASHNDGPGRLLSILIILLPTAICVPLFLIVRRLRRSGSS